MAGSVDAQYVIVSSDDRDYTKDTVGYTTSDFRVKLPRVVDTRRKKIKVVDMIMNNGQYSVETTRRKIVAYIPSIPATYTVSLAVGAYNATEIASDLQDKLNTAGSGDSAVFTVSYSSKTYKMTISLEVSAVATAFQLKSLSSSDNIGRKLGFDYASETSSATSHTGNSMVQLYDLFNTIAIQQFKQNIVTTDSTNIPKTYMFRVISRSGESAFKFDDDRYEFIFEKDIDWLDIKLYDQSGALLRNNGGKVVITLLITPL